MHHTFPTASQRLQQGLYLVSTPIGNIRDITLRALDILATADIILCEDTRVTGKLLHHYSIDARMRPFTDHHDPESVLSLLAEGKSVALASDAGTPLLSDPGQALVAAVRAAGYPVFPVPGANALLPALQMAALPTGQFLFLGFAPPKTNARQLYMAQYRDVSATLVFYESPSRLANMVADAATVFGQRSACVCREITKLHEETLAFTLGDDVDFSYIRGECVVVIAGAELEKAQASQNDVRSMLLDAMKQSPLSKAVAMVAAVTGQPRKEIYDLALAIRDEQS